MAENVGQYPEADFKVTTADREEESRSFVEALRRSEGLRALGLADKAPEVARVALCSLWRNTPAQELDVIRGQMPPGVELMLASCGRPHGRHEPPDIFLLDNVVNDVAEHLSLPRDQSLAAFNSVFDVLRGLVPEDDRYVVCLLLDSPNLLELFRCQS